jgi:oligosaccharide repeat unit polymerase
VSPFQTQQIAKPSLATSTTAAITATLALSVGLVGTWVVTQPADTVQIAAGVLFLAVIGLVVLGDTLRGRLDIANIKYVALLGFALFLGLGMIADVFSSDYSFSGSAIILAFASLILFLAGFGLVSSPRKTNDFAGPTFSITPNQLYYMSVIFFLLGFAFLLLEWQLYGSLVTYSGDLASQTREISNPMPYVHVFTQLVFPATVMTLIQFRQGLAFIRKCVLTPLLATTLVYYFFGGARSNLVWLTLSFVVVWAEVPNHRKSQRVGLKPFVVCLLAGVAILIMSSLRSKMSMEVARDISPADTVAETWNSLDTYTQFRRTLDFFPLRADYLQGYSFYGIIANPIPRVFWEDKPIGVGKLASMLYDGNASNSIGLSLPGELYANFGFVGALIGMFFSGLLTGGVYRWYRRQRGDHGALVMYVLILSYVVWEVRGDILDATMPFFYYVLPIAVCLALVSTMNRVRLRNLALANSSAAAKSNPRGFASVRAIHRRSEPLTS